MIKGGWSRIKDLAIGRWRLHHPLICWHKFPIRMELIEVTVRSFRGEIFAGLGKKRFAQ
jgi:hypothetical protein